MLISYFEMEQSLPPPPPVVPPHVSAKALTPKRVPMARRGFGSKGQKLQLLTNHFKVGMAATDGHFFHYSVYLFLSYIICYENIME